MKARTASPMAHEPLDASLFTRPRKADYWNDFYQKPASLFEHTMVQRRDYAHRYIVTHVPKTDRILDLGCGAGVLTEALVASGYRVTAADLSHDMLELARKRLAGYLASSYRLVQANCLDLPFDNAEFDVVVSMGMFGYFDEVYKALREVRRVLRPGGTFIMSVRNPYNLYMADLGRLPFRALGKLGRALRSRTRRDSAELAARPGAAAEAPFRIAIHEDPSALIAGVTYRGYSLVEFDGLGYGPVTFFGKEFLPARLSIGLSDRLDRFFRRTGLQQRARWVADVSFYVFRADSTAQRPADRRSEELAKVT